MPEKPSSPPHPSSQPHRKWPSQRVARVLVSGQIPDASPAVTCCLFHLLKTAVTTHQRPSRLGLWGSLRGGGQAQRGSLDPHSSQLPTCTSLPTESLLFHLHMVSRVPEQKDCRGGSIYLAMRKLPSMLGWGFPMGQLLRGTYLCSHMAPHLCLSVSKHNKLNGSPSYPSLNGISTLLCCWFPIWSGWTLVGIPPGKNLHNNAFTPSPSHFSIQVVLLREAHNGRERCSEIQILIVHEKLASTCPPSSSPALQLTAT